MKDLLSIKPRQPKGYDCVSLGEIMLRLDPGEGRIKTARSFNLWEGGGEYNVSRGLARCFGLRTAVATALVDNEVGRLLEGFILQGGVDNAFIRWQTFDGIGRTARNGLNFTERGFGIRGALGVSDRANTAASQLKAGDFDWKHIFDACGTRWFHTGGIFAALSTTTPALVLEALKAAKQCGVIASFDLNYRPSLWNCIGSKEEAQRIGANIAEYVDVLIGNEEDFTQCLGFEVAGNGKGLSSLDTDGYIQMHAQVLKRFPNVKAVATTLRTVKTATVNGWGAICTANGMTYHSQMWDSLEIMDRVGGGDSFAAGLIYGLMQHGDPQYAVDCGAAHGALAMTTPGDTSMASVKEVESLMKNGSMRVVR